MGSAVLIATFACRHRRSVMARTLKQQVAAVLTLCLLQLFDSEAAAQRKSSPKNDFSVFNRRLSTLLVRYLVDPQRGRVFGFTYWSASGSRPLRCDCAASSRGPTSCGTHDRQQQMI